MSEDGRVDEKRTHRDRCWQKRIMRKRETKGKDEEQSNRDGKEDRLEKVIAIDKTL